MRGKSLGNAKTGKSRLHCSCRKTARVDSFHGHGWRKRYKCSKHFHAKGFENPEYGAPPILAPPLRKQDGILLNRLAQAGFKDLKGRRCGPPKKLAQAGFKRNSGAFSILLAQGGSQGSPHAGILPHQPGPAQPGLPQVANLRPLRKQDGTLPVF